MITLDEQWHKTSVASFMVTPGLEHQVALSDKYHQYRELFDPKTFAKLLKHRSYDHAINLVSREQPP